MHRCNKRDNTQVLKGDNDIYIYILYNIYILHAFLCPWGADKGRCTINLKGDNAKCSKGR